MISLFFHTFSSAVQWLFIRNSVQDVIKSSFFLSCNLPTQSNQTIVFKDIFSFLHYFITVWFLKSLCLVRANFLSKILEKQLNIFCVLFFLQILIVIACLSELFVITKTYLLEMPSKKFVICHLMGGGGVDKRAGGCCCQPKNIHLFWNI